MAVLNKGILGGFSGVVGEIEGNSGKFGSVIKCRKSVAVVPSGTVMTSQRLAYQATIALWRSIPMRWKSIFLADKGKDISNWNNFLRSNINACKAVLQGSYLDYQLSFSTLPECIYDVTADNGTSTIYLQRLTGENAFPSFNSFDQVYLLVFDSTGKFIIDYKGMTRHNDLVWYPAPWLSAYFGEVLYFYVALASVNGLPFSQFVQSAIVMGEID